MISLSCKTNIRANSLHLLDSHRLRQIAGEVDVDTLGNSKVVCHELERDDIQETLQSIDSLRDLNSLDLVSREFVVAFVADDDRTTATGDDY